MTLSRYLLAFGLGVKMSLYNKIVEIYPELTDDNFISTIMLQDDSDGLGDFIAEWNYEKPIPDGLTVGKPTK
jgi:hypothetical protein